MVLAYWFSVGAIVGVLGYLFLRSQGEQGYNIIGEVLLGSLGALSLAMGAGVMLGWGQMFARGVIKYDELIISGLTAAIGAVLVLGYAIYVTLRASPAKHR
ncbi:MAG: hypothetical protein EPO26_16010 [Chloroflexota bacterium]|nr:MAG: hypothetical protein EPO26_16010 [Chloroflexota bacterium]